MKTNGFPILIFSWAWWLWFLEIPQRLNEQFVPQYTSYNTGIERDLSYASSMCNFSRLALSFLSIMLPCLSDSSNNHRAKVFVGSWVMACKAQVNAAIAHTFVGRGPRTSLTYPFYAYVGTSPKASSRRRIIVSLSALRCPGFAITETTQSLGKEKLKLQMNVHFEKWEIS